MKPAVSLGACVLAMLAAWPALGQTTTGTILVRVRSGAAPVSSADVTAGDVTVETDVRGEARLTLPAGDHEVTVVRAGFASATFTVSVRAGEEVVTSVQVQERSFEDQVTVVSSTRTGTLIGDQPIRVEAVPEEEIEENSTIAPGNLTTLLNELGGLRVQTIVPSLGGAELRLHGLRGRYTQILTDELPLYGDQPDAFGLLQVPPLDLAQVEVIKGTTSALYGGSALAGIVNLVSRRPGGEPEILVNQTSHLGTDIVGFVPHMFGPDWGYTLLASGHRQSESDLDGDGWADLPGYRRAVLRPRLYWNDQAGHALFATVGGMSEDREGGTVENATTPAGEPFRDTLETRRFDVGRSRGGLELNGTVFASKVSQALLTRDSVVVPGSVELVNAAEPTRTYGSELIVHYSRGPWHVIGTDTHLHSTESDPGGSGRREVPLTPEDTAELAAILESEVRGRIGIELSYIGRQHVEDDPYRDVSAS